MGASQHDLVGAAAEHLLHRAADARLGLGRLLPILLDQLDEPFADGGDDLDPLGIAGRRAAEQVALQTAGRGQHPHYSAAGVQAGGFHGRLHPDDGRRGVLGPEEVDGGRQWPCCRRPPPACNPHPAASQRPGRPACDLLGRTRAVGTVLSVAQVNERLAGQRAAQLPPDRQSAETRIVNAYGVVIHPVSKALRAMPRALRRSDRLPPACNGPAGKKALVRPCCGS